MARIFAEITPQLQAWIGEQKVFFVGTAPLAADGLLNCSPKGLDTLRVAGPREVVYLDLTGSGVETVANLKENGRIVLMFCAFDRAPRIVRLHGRGAAHEPGTPEFAEYERLFPPFLGARAIIRVAVKRVSDSCGYGVPVYQFAGPRAALTRWAQEQGEEGLARYRREENARSINGLPGAGRV